MFRIFWGILFLVLAPQMVFAKDKANQSWDNLSRLQAGQKVQVVQMDMKSLKGTFVGFSEEALSLRVKKKNIAVPHEDVLRVSLRERSKRMRNALIGAAIGAVPGAAAAVFGEKCRGAWKAACVAYPVGIGAAMGALFPGGYRTIYRAKKQQAGTTP